VVRAGNVSASAAGEFASWSVAAAQHTGPLRLFCPGGKTTSAISLRPLKIPAFGIAPARMLLSRYWAAPLVLSSLPVKNEQHRFDASGRHHENWP